MLAIFKREFKAFFYSPIAYVLIGIFIFIAAIIFSIANLGNGNAEINSTLSLLCLVLVFIIPILTMKLLAEDRKTGADVLLMSSPVSTVSIVLGKFFAALSVFAIMMCVSLIFPIILAVFGKPSASLTFGGYLGYLLLGAAYVAIGTFASSITKSQIIAAVVSLITILSFMFMQTIAGVFGGGVAEVLNWLSLVSRFSGFSQGVIELSAVVYYVSFIVVFLFLTVKIVEKRRWS